MKYCFSVKYLSKRTKLHSFCLSHILIQQCWAIQVLVTVLLLWPPGFYHFVKYFIVKFVLGKCYINKPYLLMNWSEEKQGNNIWSEASLPIKYAAWSIIYNTCMVKPFKQHLYNYQLNTINKCVKARPKLKFLKKPFSFGNYNTILAYV